MREFKCESWADFRQKMQGYFRLDHVGRSRFVFRGLSSVEYTIKPTLDRMKIFETDREREEIIAALLKEFRREAIRIGMPWGGLPSSDGFELLARHYGLPSPITDWTESVYVAAFFACHGLSTKQSDSIAVYVLERPKIEDTELAQIEFIDDIELIRFNRRALHQRGIFIRHLTADKPFESLVGDALFRIVMPSSVAIEALADLDEMTINQSFLFADAEGAAQTAVSRILGIGE